MLDFPPIRKTVPISINLHGPSAVPRGAAAVKAERHSFNDLALETYGAGRHFQPRPLASHRQCAHLIMALGAALSGINEIRAPVGAMPFGRKGIKQLAIN